MDGVLGVTGLMVLGGKEKEKALDADAGVSLESQSDLLLLLISLAVDKLTAANELAGGVHEELGK